MGSDADAFQRLPSKASGEAAEGQPGGASGSSSGGGLSHAIGDALPCTHCGEPTYDAISPSDLPIFCCQGCRGAYELIHGWGLGDFYAIRDQMKLVGAPQPAGTIDRYEQFDSPEFMGDSTPVDYGDGLKASDAAVHGLHCGACAWLIERAASAHAGLESVHVRMSDHTLRVIFDPSRTQMSSIARFLDRLGYRIAPIERDNERHIQLQHRRMLTQIAVAGFLAANAMWIAVALYAGDFSGLDPDHRYFLSAVGMMLGATAVIGPGRTFFTGALSSLRSKTPHMDLPVALGLSVGALVGSINAFNGTGDIYFDSLATLVFFLLIGRWIQFRQQQRAAKAVDLMLRITPRHAHLVDEQGHARTVLVDRLSPGDRVRVKAGESIPADGRLIDGVASIDRALLTGESHPVEVEEGAQVAAGTVNIGQSFDLSVEAVGRRSRIGRVMQSVETATAEKIPIVQLADRIGGVFVVVVTLLAMVTFAYWMATDIGQATAHATALLIVACPCALALATPLAISVGLGRAAKASVLIRDGVSLQQLASPGTIWFDKTGTLTEGRLQVVSVLGDVEALRLAAAIERESSHPVARALVRETEQRGLPMDVSSKLYASKFGGVMGRAAGKSIHVGNRKFIQACELEIPASMRQAIDRWVESGESPLLIAIDRKVVCCIGLRDPLRTDARQVVDRLHQLGWQLGILSGDQPEIVRRVADELGIAQQRARGGLAPEEKLAIIRESRKPGQTVVMVGDGANDGAALAASDVGIAVRGAAEVSLQAAPVFVATGRLASLPALFRGATRTSRLIYISFAVSLAYNLIAVGLAMAGWINPLVAAVLMPLSSVSVIAITFLGGGFGIPEPIRTSKPAAQLQPSAIAVS